MTDVYTKIDDDTLEVATVKMIAKADLEKAKVFYENDIAVAKLALVNEKLDLLK